MDDNNNKCKIGLDPIKMGQFFEKINNIHETTQKILKKVEKQNGRVDKLERWKSRIIGAVVVIGAGVPFLIKWIFK